LHSLLRQSTKPEEFFGVIQVDAFAMLFAYKNLKCHSPRHMSVQIMSSFSACMGKTCGEKFARRSEWYGVLMAMFLKTQVLWDATLCPSRIVAYVSKTFKTWKGTCPTTENGIPKDWHFQQRNFPSCLLPAQPDNILSVTQCCFTGGGIWNKNRSFNHFSDKAGVECQINFGNLWAVYSWWHIMTYELIL
jgi:hypothetical protein